MLGRVVAVVAVAVGVAQGVQLVSPGGRPLRGNWQSWADSALVPTATGRVTVRTTGCPALPRAAGCVYSRHPRVIYLKHGLHNPRGVLLHELGHVYDLTVLSNKDRGRFRRIMHRKGASWWHGRTPLAEWFAEGYSWCARYAKIVSIRRYAIYHYRPTARQHRQVCDLIKRAVRDRRPPAPPPAPPVVTGDPAPPAPPPVSPGVVPGDPVRDSRTHADPHAVAHPHADARAPAADRDPDTEIAHPPRATG